MNNFIAHKALLTVQKHLFFVLTKGDLKKNKIKKTKRKATDNTKLGEHSNKFIEFFWSIQKLILIIKLKKKNSRILVGIFFLDDGKTTDYWALKQKIVTAHINCVKHQKQTGKKQIFQ